MYLYPWKSFHQTKKYNVILDLDNTLICSLHIPDEVKKVPDNIKNKFNSIPMKKYFQIFERPYLQEFLTYLFNTFNVSIFTAADKEYAIFIIENIILKDKNRKLDYILFNYHSDISASYYGSIKDLSLIWNLYDIPGYNKNNTLIIDDLSEVYENNPKNSIKIKRFDLMNPHVIYDIELLKIRKILDWRIHRKSGFIET